MGFHLDSDGVVQMFSADAPSLCGEPVWVYVLSRSRAASALTALVGPADPLAARKSDPESLRALYGANRWENGVWVTRDEASAERVVGELFAGSPIMDFSDLPSVNGSPDRRKLRKASSRTSSIRSDYTASTGTKGLSVSGSRASLSVPGQTAKPGFKARPVPSMAAPSISPRTTRASALRAGNAGAAPPPRARQSQEERDRTFEGVPGHKRRESFSIASTAPPVIVPRPNRSAQLRAQKLADDADPKAARRRSMIEIPAAKDKRHAPLSPEEAEQKNRATFEGIPGHKRRESIAVASTAPPTVAPRVNRSSMLRAQKLAGGGSAGPPSSFKGAQEGSPGPAPVRTLSTRSSRTSVSGAPSGTTSQTSLSSARAAPASIRVKSNASRTSLIIPNEPTKSGALTPISNGAITPRASATPAPPTKAIPGSPKKPDIVPRTNRSALLRAAAKLKSAAGSVGGSMSKAPTGRSLAI
jgi:hypothetical protein